MRKKTSTPAPHYYFRSPNGVGIRLRGDDVIVEMDPLPERTHGGIIIPDNVGDRGDAGVLTTGTVRAFGFMEYGGFYRADGEHVPWNRVPLPELEIGMKVVFVRFYAEQHTNKSIQLIVGDGFIKLKPLDILFGFDEEDAHRIFR